MRKPEIEAPKTFEYDPHNRRGEEIVRETREYELITPLFGGGVEPKKADEVSVIRATEIRGHLRFWWRATRGGQFKTTRELKEHEDALFGSTESNSAVQIEVEVKNFGSDFERPNEFAYVWFPLRGTEEKLLKEVKFSASFSYPTSAKNEINSSLWAWENFGGIGARTRRGFGAICRVDENETPYYSSVDFERSCSELFSDDILEKTSSFPTLHNANCKIIHLEEARTRHPIRTPLKNLNESEFLWSFLVTKLQNFRQSPRNISVYNGESHWPEPDAIRRITNQNAAYRSPDHPIGMKFPRANLGLPIEFKFKDRGDPEKQTLEGKDKNQARLSSPLIIRPIRCSDKTIGIAIALNAQRLPPNGIHLKGFTNNIEIQLVKNDIQYIEPMRLASLTETDVLKSFLKYLEI